MNYRVLAIDNATNHFGMCIVSVDGSKISLEHAVNVSYSTNMTLLEKLVAVYRDVHNYIVSWKPDVVVYEANWGGKNMIVTKNLNQSLGAIKLAVCATMGVNAVIYEMTRKEALLAVTGNGNSGKDECIDGVERIFGMRFSSDVADAITLAMGLIFFNIKLVKPIFDEVGWDIPYTQKRVKNKKTMVGQLVKELDKKQTSAICRNVFDFVNLVDKPC